MESRTTQGERDKPNDRPDRECVQSATSKNDHAAEPDEIYMETRTTISWAASGDADAQDETNRHQSIAMRLVVRCHTQERTASFRLRINLRKRDSRRYTNLYVYIPPEHIRRLERILELVPGEDDTVALRFELHKPPVLIGPRADLETTLSPAEHPTAKCLRELAAQLDIRLLIPKSGDDSRMTQDLLRVCQAFALPEPPFIGILNETPLASLYGGRGGVIVSGRGDWPPPAAPGAQDERRRAGGRAQKVRPPSYNTIASGPPPPPPQPQQFASAGPSDSNKRRRLEDKTQAGGDRDVIDTQQIRDQLRDKIRDELRDEMWHQLRDRQDELRRELRDALHAGLVEMRETLLSELEGYVRGYIDSSRTR